jgi:ectonucleoside triphosphate diphosphohydrolase 5/6
LKNEVFKERKTGLSSFADHVDQAEDQINELLKIADQEVSRFKHRNTPLVLRATAGLKLLNETKQKLLLESVSNAFDKYGFYRLKLDIAIMNETKEGIDAWLTLVYLKGEQFYGSRIAALDLGGGSTQITYNPSLSNTSLAEKLNLL